MKKLTLFLILFVMVFCLFALTGCGNGNTDKNENGKLIVAMELAYPPFETKDNAGDPTGVSVDFAKDFGEYLGLEVEIVNTAWAGLIPSLQTGSADMVISSMTITESRKQEVDFSDPYANAYLAILTNKDSGVASVSDLNQPGKKVAVKEGTTGHMYAINNLTNAEIIVLTDESACVTEVSQGKADGFLYDQLTIYRNNMNNPETTSAVFIPFQEVDNWGVAVKKGNTELLDSLNAFIKKYNDEGGFDKLTDKYLKEEREAFEELGFKWFFDVSE
jgi:polar amino acid transport system substrate-binding protein